ncbi:MAG: hypothetical protein IKI40_04545 [Treponema sp.]|nr:hypothetical protein [Treponema sp.]
MDTAADNNSHSDISGHGHVHSRVLWHISEHSCHKNHKGRYESGSLNCKSIFESGVLTPLL